MKERVLFLTGRLAEKRLEKVLQGMGPAPFDWSIFNLGVKVAALMTEPILMRRLPRPIDADRVVVPGRCRADLTRLAQEFGVPFERGPDELKDLPAFLGKSGAALDLSRHALRIFAEIVDASQMSIEAILIRAEILRVEGADVIDLGCLPDTPFPHLEDAVRELKARGFAASVDSADPDELRRGAAAGADYLFSLTEHNLAIAEESGARPVLIPARHGDLASLYRAAEEAEKRSLKAILDPVIDPIHFGFAEFAVALSRSARALAGSGNADGDRESDRAHRRRTPSALRRCCLESAQSSASPTCSLSMSARTPAGRSKSTTRPGASCTRRRRTRACREAMGGRFCKSTTPRHFLIRVRRSPKPPRK